MFARFSTTTSALQLLHVGECGRVTRIAARGDRTAEKLHRAGIQVGTLVALEQRFPHFVVRVGRQRHILSQPEIRAISVRLAADCSRAS